MLKLPDIRCLVSHLTGWVFDSEELSESITCTGCPSNKSSGSLRSPFDTKAHSPVSGGIK